MEPLTNMSGSPEMSGAIRWMEAARIAFSAPRNEQEATTEEQTHFQGNGSQHQVYLFIIFGNIFAQASCPSPKAN
jgi:hypothetical protein|tara:strand:+ start:1959 stop:2183 length:225 start_codon:yes stop_codon:yes gene_type:complete